MLPRPLCEELCSLNPDQDRLTFSVIWTMTSAGEVTDLLPVLTVPTVLTIFQLQLSLCRYHPFQLMVEA